MGDKKTTRNLIYLLCVVLLIAAALIVYVSYENKAQAPTTEQITADSNSDTQEQKGLAEVSSDLNRIDDLSVDELDQIQDDLDSIDLSDI